MKSQPMLQDVDFGEEAAEAEQHLESYFVETSTFRDVVEDRIDVVLGAKGSGKSAIFRRLALDGQGVPELDTVDVLTAFNLQGDVMFKSLCRRADLSEAGLRTIWMAFIVAVIGDHILRRYWDETNLRPLKKMLKRSGLISKPQPVNLLWSELEEAVAENDPGLTLEGELGAKIPGTPVSAKGKFRFNRRRKIAALPDLEAVLRYESELLNLLGRRAWILFDRLDEAFTEDRTLERKALRALLRTHLDVASFSPAVRTKLCLRTDVLARITVDQGFVNATHLRRLVISWDRDGIVDLIVRRIRSSDEVLRAYQIETEQMRTRSGRQRVCETVLPAKLHGEDLLQWIEDHTTDAHGVPNPRNVISLLRLARMRQLDAYDRDTPDFDAREPLIGDEAMFSAFVELSSQRLSDTVIAEANHLRSTVERLRGCPVRFGRVDLATICHLPPTGNDVTELATALQDAGVLRAESSKLLSIPRIYRPALECRVERGATRMTDDEQEELRRTVDEAVERLRRTRASFVSLPEIDDRQRDFIRNHIRARRLSVRPRPRNTGPHSIPSLDLYGGRDLRHLARSLDETQTELERDIEMEVNEVVGPLLEQVSKQESLAISGPLDRVLHRAVQARDRRFPSDQDIRLVALLRTLGDVRAAFARDLSGSTLEEQDASLATDDNRARLRRWLSEVVTAVRDDRYDASLRAMGPRVFAEAVSVISEHEGVTYRVAATPGGIGAQLVVVKVS